MNYYIGADLGTSSLKLSLVNVKGEIVNSVSKSYDLFYPQVGWSEQNPRDWWLAFVEGIRELVADIDASSVCSLGIAGQMHGLVILDENDNVIRNAILWNDGRTDKETAYLNTVKELADYTANMAFAGFTAPKILWLKENEPDNFNKISKIMLPKDYINYLLTGVHCTDYSDASGMLLLDVKNKCWSKEMLQICGITEQQMPHLFDSYDVIGTIKADIAALLGLPDSVKVVAGAGDNAGAAVGSATVSDGKCNISLGTSGTVFISSEKFPELTNKAIHTFCHADGGWHIMGCILSAAVCNKWFCTDILGTDDYSAEQIGISDDMLGNNNVYFLPYLMGERSPINNTDARGTFIGMSLDTKRESMVQAVLEGVAFAIRDNIEIVKNAGISIEKSGFCGGGAKSALWRKILANVLNITLEIPVTEEGPSFGGALLAMVGNGDFESVKDCAESFAKTACVVTPDAEIAARYEQQYNKFKNIYPAVKDVFGLIK
ncbi:MAG: xylulokinase [Clostridia bacterium]|nr:xylulokinase [Clostridia bacterium]